MTLCIERFTYCFFGTATALVTTAVVVAVVVLLTLTHRYNAPTTCILPPPFNMHGIV